MNGNRIYSLVIYLIWKQRDEASRATKSKWNFVENKMIKNTIYALLACVHLSGHVYMHLKHTKAITNATLHKKENIIMEPLVWLWTGLLVCLVPFVPFLFCRLAKYFIFTWWLHEHFISAGFRFPREQNITSYMSMSVGSRQSAILCNYSKRKIVHIFLNLFDGATQTHDHFVRNRICPFCKMKRNKTNTFRLIRLFNVVHVIAVCW